MKIREKCRRIPLKRVWIIAAVFIILFPLIQLLFVWGTAPLLIKHTVKESVSCYTDGEYESIRNGKAAAEFFPDPKSVNESDVIKYYYRDNSYGSILLLGRCPSLQLLDLAYDEGSYEAAREELLKQGYVTATGDPANPQYENVYVLDVSEPERSICLLGGGICDYVDIRCAELDDEARVIRYMVLSDVYLENKNDIKASFSEGIYSVISQSIALQHLTANDG